MHLPRFQEESVVIGRVAPMGVSVIWDILDSDLNMDS